MEASHKTHRPHIQVGKDAEVGDSEHQVHDRTGSATATKPTTKWEWLEEEEFRAWFKKILTAGALVVNTMLLYEADLKIH